MSRLVRTLLTLLAFSSVTVAHASVVSGTITGGTVKGTGSVVILDPTTSSFAVGKDNFDTNNLYVFNEQQNVKLLTDLALDLGTTLPTGTVVSSHLVVFDPLLVQTVKATLVFNQPILGIARRDSTLLATNFLGAPSVTYNTPSFFGLEPGEDFLTVGAPTPDTLPFRLSASIPGDVFRVFTQGVIVSSVPEPATWAYMIVGMLACGAALRTARRPAPATAA